MAAYKNFKIVWEIEVEAEDAVDAAQSAYEIMMDPAGIPPILTVTDPDGQSEDIDLDKVMDSEEAEDE